MRKRIRNFQIALGTMLLLLLTPSNAETLSGAFDVECRQPNASTLTCSYRTVGETKLLGASAEFSNVRINAQLQNDEAHLGPSRSAILFLVDTSDPARAAVVRQNRDTLRELANLSGNQQLLGLAAFDAELRVLCALPCSRDDLSIASEQLVATGKTTELYRNVLEAINLIRAQDVDHRHIVIFSDGLAEDLAYHHEDVVNAAREAKIIISGIGYPRSVAHSIALQTLRRLAEETGGVFAKADLANYALPDGLLPDLMLTVDHGGKVSFDLSPLSDADVSGTIVAPITFRTTKQDSLVNVTMMLPEPKPVIGVAPQQAGDTVPVVAKTTAVAPAPLPIVQGQTWAWFWYGLPAMIFSAILAVALAYAVSARRRRDDLADQTVDRDTPHAFFVSAYDENTRYKVDHTPWRIGRSRNNELTLDDTSVSRLHAEVRRDALGQFTLQDLESLNGVFVNGEAIKLEHLDEGDRVEIGDVGFLFTFQDEDYARQDATVLVHTRKPQ